MKKELQSLLQSNLIAYYGFTGHENLGDEAIWDATQKVFKEKKVYPIALTRFDIVNKLLGNKKKNLLILGGGTLIGDNTIDGKNKFREQYSFLARNANFKIVFGTGIGSIYNEIIAPRWLVQWKNLLDDCDYIGVRGKQSQLALNVLGVDCEVIGDSACTWAYATRTHVQRKVLGINIGAKRDLLPEDKIGFYSEFITSKFLTGWEIEFYVLNPSDYQLTLDFAKICKINNPILIITYNDTEKYLEKISGVHCFIGTRLHSVILAMCAGVPSIMIGYSPKALDFMESVEQERFHIAVSELTVEKLNELFEIMLINESCLSENILNNLNIYKDLQKLRAKEICLNL